ncbi:MAG: ABC transporter permease subunit [Nannocystaceae bacterium]
MTREPAARRRLPVVVGAYVVVGLALPLGLLLARALLGDDGGAAIDARLWLRSGLRSLGLAGLVALAASLGAYPLARLVAAPALFALLVVSPLARALGVLGLGLEPGWIAVLAAEIAGALPLAALLVHLRLRGLDPHLLEAAADLGAGPWRRWRAIVLPLLRPALLLAALWSALLSLGDVATLELAGGGKLYSLTLLLREVALELEDGGAVAAITALLVALTIPCAWALLRGVRAFAATSRRGGAALRRPTAGLRVAGLAALLVAVAPLVGLVAALGEGPSAASLAPLRYAVAPTLRGLPLVALVAAVAGFALALRRPALGRGLGALVVAPLAIPPVVQGLMTLELGRTTGLPPGELLTLCGLLPASVALAYVAALLARAALPPAIDDAARDLGAGAAARLRRIWAPLLAAPALGVALALVVLNLGAVSVPAFTSGPGGSTLAIAMTIVARGSGSDAIAWVTAGLALAPLLLVPPALLLGRRLRARREVAEP